MEQDWRHTGWNNSVSTHPRLVFVQSNKSGLKFFVELGLVFNSESRNRTFGQHTLLSKDRQEKDDLKLFFLLLLLCL